MKHFDKRIFLGALAAFALMLGACDLTELNDNPNEPSTVTVPNLLTGALQGSRAVVDGGDSETEVGGRSGLAALYWGEFTLGRFANLYAQYWTQNQYTEEDRYGFPTRRSGVLNDMWEDYYLALNDLQEIIRVNRETPTEASAFGPNENQIAIAKILQAWTFQVMTDMWGPIPFTSALQGREGDFTPAYASQQEIYQGIIDSLTAASDMIDPDVPTLSSGDLVYGGDMSKWKKFANSVKMRAAIRIADVAPELASQAINEALEAGVFESNDDNALAPFNEAPPYQNPIYMNYEVSGRDDWAMPNSILDPMKANDDPRLPAYATDVDGEYIGYTYGLPTGEAQARFQAGPFSRPSEAVRQADSPAILMLYDEVLFTQAEAAQRGFISGDPATLYQDAIRASVNYWDERSEAADVDEADIDAFISRVPYDASNWEQVLGTQKWLALYMQGVQGWSEWRRLDFEDVFTVPPGDPGGAQFDIALRLPYPSDEGTLNQENRDAAVNNLLGGNGADADDQSVRLWWDVN